MSGMAFIMREQTEGQTVRVRLASPADRQVVGDLFRRSVIEANEKHRQAYPLMDEEEWDRYNLFLLAQMESPRFATLLAEKGGQPVGMISGVLLDRPFGKPHTYCAVSGLWIHADHRRDGLAMELLSGIAQWAEARGVHTCEWNALGNDDKWTKRGFPPVCTTHQTTWIAGKVAELAHLTRDDDDAR